MKKFFLILIIISLTILVSCQKTSFKYDVDILEDQNLSYNGNTYVKYSDPYGKYQAAFDSEDSVLIGRGFFVSHFSGYYGNDLENPEYIFSPRWLFYVREDLTVDNSSLLTVCNIKEHFSFRIRDIILEEKIDHNTFYENYEKNTSRTQLYEKAFDFYVWIEPDEFAYSHIQIYKINDNYYIQDAYDSDLYMINDNFIKKLEVLDLDRYGGNYPG